MSDVRLDIKATNRQNYNDKSDNDDNVGNNNNNKEREGKDKRSIAHNKLKLLKQDQHTDSVAEKIKKQHKNNNDQSEKSLSKLKNLTQESQSNKKSIEPKDTNKQAQSIESSNRKPDKANQLSRSARAAPASGQGKSKPEPEDDILSQAILDNDQVSKLPGQMFKALKRIEHALFDTRKENKVIDDVKAVLKTIASAPVVAKSANKIQTDLNYFHEEFFKKAEKLIKNNKAKISNLENRDTWESEDRAYKDLQDVKDKVTNEKNNRQYALRSLRNQVDEKIERHKKIHQSAVSIEEAKLLKSTNDSEALRKHNARLKELRDQLNKKIESEEENFTKVSKELNEKSDKTIKRIETPKLIRDKIDALEQENKLARAQLDGDQRDKLQLARKLVRSEAWRTGEAGAAAMNFIAALVDPESSDAAKVSAGFTFVGETLRSVSAEIDLRRAAQEKEWELKKKAFDAEQKYIPKDKRKINPFIDNPYKKPKNCRGN